MQAYAAMDSRHPNEKKESRENKIAGEQARALRSRPVSPPPPLAKAQGQLPSSDFGVLRQRNQPAPILSGQPADEVQLKAVAPLAPPLPSSPVSGDQAKLAPASSDGKPPAPPAATETVEVAGSAGAVEMEAATANDVAKRKDSLSKSKAIRAEVAAQAASAPADGLRDEDRLSAVVSRSGFVHAPAGRVIWSVGVGGQILRSLDAGKTWQAQPSGVTTALLTGAAPSEAVCWIVGAEGIILRTTDGGVHRLRVPAPTHADLIGISARDAMNAVAWGQAPGSRYATTDGGKSWSVTDK